MEFEWIITVVGKEQEVGQKSLKKITFVVEEVTEKEYKQSIAVDLFWEKIDMIKGYKVGDVVKLSLNFRAREYNDKWFNSIGAWKIEKAVWSRSSSKKTDDEDLPF